MRSGWVFWPGILAGRAGTSRPDEPAPWSFIMSHDINPIARALAAGALVGALVLYAPSQAAAAPDRLLLAQASPTQTTPPLTPNAAPNATATQKAPAGKASHMSRTDRVEAHIKDLHAKLRITAAQETQWGTVAQAMRDDAKAIETIAAERAQKIGTMNAVDDLRSYASLSEAHADGMKKLVAAFDPLYDSMSDSQKKAADALFRHDGRHHSPAKKS